MYIYKLYTFIHNNLIVPRCMLVMYFRLAILL